MLVSNYREVLNQLETCDYVMFKGIAHVRTTVPVQIKIYKGTPNWESYVERTILSWDKGTYQMNKGYGHWNGQNFPDACGDYDVSGLDMKDCFFCINGELVCHEPQESVGKGKLTQIDLDEIRERFASTSK